MKYKLGCSFFECFNGAQQDQEGTDRGLSTGPSNGHFVILVGLRNPDLNETIEDFEMTLSPDEKHSELDDEEDDANE